MSREEKYSWKLDAADRPMRLDQWLSRQTAPKLSRSGWQRLIKDGFVLLNGRPVRANALVRAGDGVTAVIPPPEKMELAAEDIPLEILFEDDGLLVINKPPGMVVHPAAGNRKHTLVNALLHHCAGRLAGIGGVERPGIVHRLDADTSGCLLVAKSDAVHQSLAAQFKSRTVEKIYLAWVWGEPRRPGGRLEDPIGRHPVHRKKMAVAARGKPAVTEWKIRERHGAVSLLECKILTGRTHQIRVHLSHMGHAVVGDKIYGRPRRWTGDTPRRQMLHAWKLSFHHPETGRQVLIEAPLPGDFLAFGKGVQRGDRCV